MCSNYVAKDVPELLLLCLHLPSEGIAGVQPCLVYSAKEQTQDACYATTPPTEVDLWTWIATFKFP